MTCWYAVQSKRHNEHRVARFLGQKGVPAFLPLLEVTRWYGPRRIRLLEPLFPGYLFARTLRMQTAPAAWDAVRWAPGVRTILGTDTGPTPVPDEVIMAIQERVRDLGFVRPRPPGRGQRVRIRGGPFAGLEAVFDQPLSREGRVRVFLSLLGQERRVELDLADLERI